MSGERARLFVALELPDEVLDALVRWRASVLEGAEGVRPVPRPDLHVTLCFLGWRAQREIESIADACRVLVGRGALELALGEAVALPHRRPRVLAVSLEDPDGKLSATQARVAAALEAGGWYEPEQRPFHGHVTVARAGRGTRVPRSALAGPAPRAIGFHGSIVTLYRSRPGRTGSSYEALARIPLDSA